MVNIGEWLAVETFKDLHRWMFPQQAIASSKFGGSLSSIPPCFRPYGEYLNSGKMAGNFSLFPLSS
jgi:hypothetical protein